MAALSIFCVIGAIICHVILTQRIYQPKHKCGIFCGERVMSCRRFFFVKFIHLLLLEGACFILINSIMDFFILSNEGFYVISIMGFLLFILLLVALPVHYFCCRKWESKLSHTALGIYYDGLKATNFLRVTYYGVFLLRRLAHAIIIFATYKMGPLYSIIAFDVIQAFYIFYLLVVWPFDCVGMFTNLLGELSILGYFIYLTIFPSPDLQKDYKIVIIIMVVVFIITYLTAFFNIFYGILWWWIKRRRTKVVDMESKF